MKAAVSSIRGRRVWDSRGRPTVEAEVALAGGAVGRAIAPAGASTGSGEAVELRDGGDHFGGYDVTAALGRIDDVIARALIGLDATRQADIDAALVSLDGTPNKSRLGANAMIATSMAVAHAAAVAHGLPLWRYLAGGEEPGTLPLPEIQIFGGGAHAGRRVDIQDYMVVAIGATDFATALNQTAEVYLAAGRLLATEGRLAGVADEGGYWPVLDSNEQGLEFLVRAIESAGLKPGLDIAISLDIAASEFGVNGRYHLARDSRTLDSSEIIAMLLDWRRKYPIVSFEDPLAEDDASGLIRFTANIGPSAQVIGDDYLVTNAERIRAAAAAESCNAVLVKPNQAGTLTETKAAVSAAAEAGWNAVVSARSGETEDVTIVHLAVGWGAQQLKVGSFARSERMAKWNEGLRLAEQLPTGGGLPPPSAFPWGRA